MTEEQNEALLMQIDKAFGLTKHDFEKDEEDRLVPIYMKWGSEEKHTDIANLGNWSLKISKNLGDVYIPTIHTNMWVIVGEGTTLHCDDIEVGQELVENFTGFLM